jgi:tetraacyldisaccharide 4'-kinase
MNPLSPLGWIYGQLTNARNALYDREIFESYSLNAPTISIGNLTTGGTGKTPLVALVARLLAESHEKVCVLTRGYGRRNASQRVLVSNGESVLSDARTGGDEPVELAYKLIGKAAIVADRNRIGAAAWALTNLGTTVFVLDDAFQHRRAKRDFDILCIDATNPFGNGKILPAGMLRENLENLSRADMVVITRCDLVKDVSAIEDEIKRLAPELPIHRSSNKITRIVPIEAFSPDEPIADMPHAPAFAFCGLGNPSNFFRQLEKEGLDLAGRKTYSDHHFYSVKDIADIERRARSAGAELLITTVKDAVRLSGMKIGMPCYVAEIETVMADPKRFRETLFAQAAIGKPQSYNVKQLPLP